MYDLFIFFLGFSGPLGRYVTMVGGNKKQAEAVNECDTLGATLLSIHSQTEQDFISAHDSDLNGDDYYWLGLCQDTNTEVWSWEDGTEMDYTNWTPGRRKKRNVRGGRSTAKRDCAIMSTIDYIWSVETENQKHSYVCQYQGNT